MDFRLNGSSTVVELVDCVYPTVPRVLLNVRFERAVSP